MDAQNEAALAEADARIEHIRKGDFTLRLRNADGEWIHGSAVSVEQTRSHFHFGTCIAARWIRAESEDARHYQQFIRDHFNTLVCENEMKWYATERERGGVSYEDADLLMRFAEANGLAMRGHCLFWAKPKFVQPWVQALDDDELRAALEHRLTDTVPRYRGKLIAWDVNNEMLDGSFYQDRLGAHIRTRLFVRAHELDPTVPLFVNEYTILGSDARLQSYEALIRSLRAQGTPVGGLGVQEHGAERFAPPSAADAESAETRPERQWRGEGMIRVADAVRRLDRLSALGLPIHLTEISAVTADEERRAEALETLFRLGFSHPGVEAIMLWGFWEGSHWLGRDAALVDREWNLLPAGARIRDLLLHRWRTHVTIGADDAGILAFRGFYGTYTISARDEHGQLIWGTVDLLPSRTEATVTLQP